MAVFLISFFLQSKTITITNSDTANEVINMSLPMLGITVSHSAGQCSFTNFNTLDSHKYDPFHHKTADC